MSDTARHDSRRALIIWQWTSIRLLTSLRLRDVEVTSHAIDVSGSTAHIFSILARKAA